MKRIILLLAVILLNINLLKIPKIPGTVFNGINLSLNKPYNGTSKSLYFIKF
jgi:hypothetical protein